MQRRKKGADQILGRSRGGLITKVNAMVDHRGLPLAITLAPGQSADKAAVAKLLAAIRARRRGGRRGYDARAILDLISAHDGRGHVDPALYRQRNLVERFFTKIEHFRKIATLYEKPATNCLAAVLIACSRLWVRYYESAS